MTETLLQINWGQTQCTMTRVITLTLMLDAVTSVFKTRLLIVTADLTYSGPLTLRSTAASHQMRAARRSPGDMVMVSAVKVGRCPCPRSATTQTAASSVITPIKTVRVLVNTLTTPAHTPVSPCMMTCAGA